MFFRIYSCFCPLSHRWKPVVLYANRTFTPFFNAVKAQVTKIISFDKRHPWFSRGFLPYIHKICGRKTRLIRSKNTGFSCKNELLQRRVALCTLLCPGYLQPAKIFLRKNAALQKYDKRTNTPILSGSNLRFSLNFSAENSRLTGLEPPRVPPVSRPFPARATGCQHIKTTV